MGFLGSLFAKRPHDPAQAMIAWLKKQPPIARMTVAGWFGPTHNAGVVLDWILTRPDCDQMTALSTFWEAMQNAPAELAALRSDPAALTPNLALAKRIAADWREGRFILSEYGFDPAQHWSEFAKKLRKYRLKAADFDLPDGIRDPLPGPRFTLWWPTDKRLENEKSNLITDITVCDQAIERPEQWLSVRKKRLGY